MCFIQPFYHPQIQSGTSPTVATAEVPTYIPEENMRNPNECKRSRTPEKQGVCPSHPIRNPIFPSCSCPFPSLVEVRKVIDCSTQAAHPYPSISSRDPSLKKGEDLCLDELARHAGKRSSALVAEVAHQADESIVASAQGSNVVGLVVGI